MPFLKFTSIALNSNFIVTMEIFITIITTTITIIVIMSIIKILYILGSHCFDLFISMDATVSKFPNYYFVDKN